MLKNFSYQKTENKRINNKEVNKNKKEKNF